MSAPAICARRLSAGKGPATAINELYFELATGSFTALVGANGSGKTTLFEALLGLLPLRGGTVELLGREPRSARAEVGYVPQATGLAYDSQFTGREFVAAAYRGERWGVTWQRKGAARAVDEAIQEIDGQGLAQRRLADMSGGQRQRLLIAQALVNKPKLLLMDEPLSQLDPAAQGRIVTLTARLRDTLGLAVVMSTHDVNTVAGVADSVLYLAGGRGRMGSLDEVVNERTLSELYGVPMRVLRGHGQLFVMPDRPASPAALRDAASPLGS